jgi:protein MpaA
MIKYIFTPVVTCLFALFSLPLNVFAQTTDIANEDNVSAIHESELTITDSADKPTEIELADAECRRIGNKLGSVSYEDCKKLDLNWTGSRSVKQAPILFKEYPPLARRQPLGKILLLGGIHGDEYSSVSIVFKWLNTLEQYHSGLFHWRIVPLLNPDGLLQQNSTRTNANGVDLNRNFPVPDWENTALDYWIKRTYQNPRQYPGPEQLSEPESTWLAEEINRFQPDVIVSVHAPHGVVDYDGPENGPYKLGRLYLSLLGTYPGSLGNYAGLQKKIPVVTIELPYAGIMPGPTEISDIWVDLVRWLTNNVQSLPLESVAQEADPS